MYADPRALLSGKSGQRKIVQIDEAMEQLARRVQLHRETTLGEVDLYAVGTLPQAAANLGLVLAQQIGDELFAGVSRYLLQRGTSG